MKYNTHPVPISENKRLEKLHEIQYPSGTDIRENKKLEKYQKT